VAEKLPVIPCGVALIRDGRHFLIAQRRERDSFGSFWEFPGGRKNPGETFEQCVAREVKEEVGLDVAVHEKLMEIRRRHHERIVWLNFFLCSALSDPPRALECQQVLWADVGELSGYRFPPANDRVIEKLMDAYGR
jgi:mutator protein MutT